MLKFDRQVAALKERREAEEAKLVATRQKRWAGGSVELSLRTNAHPLYTSFTNIFGASISKATMRPNPRWAGGWMRFQEENRLREERRRRLRCVPYFALDRKSIAIPIELVRL
jgi:hypothetical protein